MNFKMSQRVTGGRLRVDLLACDDEHGQLVRVRAWNVRSVRQVRLQEHVVETPQWVTPTVFSSIYQVTITRWFGSPITFWRTEVDLRVWSSDSDTVMLRRRRVFEKPVAAYRDYRTCRRGIFTRLYRVHAAPSTTDREPWHVWRPFKPLPATRSED